METQRLSGASRADYEYDFPSGEYDRKLAAPEMRDAEQPKDRAKIHTGFERARIAVEPAGKTYRPALDRTPSQSPR
ncbi:hypothetical protein [Sinorhizobium medicae]|uniref:hypothetical protein n=1 Tax=Sinorhizobium medicae TaxID=110321 RepID=UPI001F45E510|nr:hypothetical protein [Sinorhizobium medicae]UWU10006.1 hypothetical protein N2598_09340 [Sinorhizobium medicae]